MRIYNLLAESVKKKDIKSILKNNNFRLGIEFEFIFEDKEFDLEDYIKHLDTLGLSDQERHEYLNTNLFNSQYENYNKFFYEKAVGSIMDYIKSQKITRSDFVNRVYDTSSEKSNKKWTIEYDISVKLTPKKAGFPIEVSTPIVSVNQGLNIIDSFFSFIKKHGYTNDTCGLHISISHPQYGPGNINKKALAASLEDKRIYKTMPSRKASKHAYSSEKELEKTGEVGIGKYKTMAIHSDRVEFRGIGGKNYENNTEEIKKIILNYITKYYKAATDRDFMSKKLGNLDYRIQSSIKDIYKPLIEKEEWNELVFNHLDDYQIWKKLINFDNEKSINSFFKSMLQIFKISHTSYPDFYLKLIETVNRIIYDKNNSLKFLLRVDHNTVLELLNNNFIQSWSFDKLKASEINSPDILKILYNTFSQTTSHSFRRITRDILDKLKTYNI